MKARMHPRAAAGARERLARWPTRPGSGADARLGIPGALLTGLSWVGLRWLRVQAPVLQVGKARPGGRQRCLHHKAEESLEQELLGEPRTAAFRHSAASL